MKGNSRRRDVRYPVKVPVVLWRGKRATELHTEDISFRGLFLRTDDAPGLRQLVRLQVPIEGGPSLSLHAMVVWVVPPGTASGRVPGVGLQFYGIGKDEQSAWESFVIRVRKEVPEPVAPPQEPIRRRAPRVAARFSVRPSGVDDLLQLFTRDISAGGMFIETDVSFPVGTTIAVDVIHPDTKEEFALVCQVRRRSDAPPAPGIGVEIVDFDDARRDAFCEFVYSGAVYEEFEIIAAPDPARA